MPRRSLPPETLLSIELSAICSRNRYTDDPAPVLDELRRAAGDRHDILAEVAGSWAGYYDGEYTHTLAAALRSIPGADAWEGRGAERRSAAPHGTTTTDDTRGRG